MGQMEDATGRVILNLFGGAAHVTPILQVKSDMDFTKKIH